MEKDKGASALVLRSLELLERLRSLLFAAGLVPYSRLRLEAVLGFSPMGLRTQGLGLGSGTLGLKKDFPRAGTAKRPHQRDPLILHPRTPSFLSEKLDF